MAPKKPGRRAGVPRYRRPGQLSIVLPGTLEPRAPRCAVCHDRSCEFCPRVPPEENSLLEWDRIIRRSASQ